MAVDRKEWLRLVEAEYLSEFVPEGGAVVKFAVVNDAEAAAVLEQDLTGLAQVHRMHTAHIDSATTRLHMIQDVFFGVAKQIKWEAAAQQFMEQLFAKQGHDWPTRGQPMSMPTLADANSIDTIFLRKAVRQWLTTEVMREPGMAQDFKIAMTQLCMDRFVPESAAASLSPTPVVEWLRGELKTVGPLKSAEIFAKITRTNGRPMLRSVCRWLRMLGYNGLVLTIDIRRLAQQSIPAGAVGLKYSPAAVMDAFEVLRQIIDNADQFEGLFLTVIADGAFIGSDQKRSIEAYTALKMRIWDDVRARDRDNPLSPLNSLTG
jgi:hypothetical protein